MTVIEAIAFSRVKAAHRQLDDGRKVMAFVDAVYVEVEPCRYRPAPPELLAQLQALVDGWAPNSPRGELMATIPTTVRLCARFRDGAHCLGLVHAGACIRCGARAETATFTLDNRPPAPAITAVSTCRHVALGDQGEGQLFAACELCRGERE